MSELKDKHAASLRKLYDTNGVGERQDQKLAFWTAKESGSLPANVTIDQAVLVYENCWLVDNYPEDFELC